MYEMINNLQQVVNDLNYHTHGLKHYFEASKRNGKNFTQSESPGESTPMNGKTDFSEEDSNLISNVVFGSEYVQNLVTTSLHIIKKLIIKNQHQYLHYKHQLIHEISVSQLNITNRSKSRRKSSVHDLNHNIDNTKSHGGMNLIDLLVKSSSITKIDLSGSNDNDENSQNKLMVASYIVNDEKRTQNESLTKLFESTVQEYGNEMCEKKYDNQLRQESKVRNMNDSESIVNAVESRYTDLISTVEYAFDVISGLRTLQSFHVCDINNVKSSGYLMDKLVEKSSDVHRVTNITIGDVAERDEVPVGNFRHLPRLSQRTSYSVISSLETGMLRSVFIFLKSYTIYLL